MTLGEEPTEESGCRKKGEPISDINTVDHLICFSSKQQFYMNRNIHWVTMHICFFPLALFLIRGFTSIISSLDVRSCYHNYE